MVIDSFPERSPLNSTVNAYCESDILETKYEVKVKESSGSVNETVKSSHLSHHYHQRLNKHFLKNQG